MGDIGNELEEIRALRDLLLKPVHEQNKVRDQKLVQFVEQFGTKITARLRTLEERVDRLAGEIDKRDSVVSTIHSGIASLEQGLRTLAARAGSAHPGPVPARPAITEREETGSIPRAAASDEWDEEEPADRDVDEAQPVRTESLHRQATVEEWDETEPAHADAAIAQAEPDEALHRDAAIDGWEDAAPGRAHDEFAERARNGVEHRHDSHEIEEPEQPRLRRVADEEAAQPRPRLREVAAEEPGPPQPRLRKVAVEDGEPARPSIRKSISRDGVQAVLPSRGFG